MSRRANDHPNTVAGQYAGQKFIYDILGRQTQTSTVIGIDGSWTALTAENPSGWIYTTATLDEMSRPTQITRPDGNTRHRTYSSCGCAGNITATTTDEQGKTKATVTDFLGRLQESRELDA